MTNSIKTGALPRMRTIRQAAAESGLAVYFVRRLIAENKVVYVKAGRKFLVNFDSLIQYLNSGGGATEQ